MRVRFTPAGRAQLLAVVEYIRGDNPRAAERFRQRAHESLRRLEQFPMSGRVIPEFPDLPYRELILPPHRFFYRVKDTTVGSLPSGTVCSDRTYRPSNLARRPAIGQHNI